MGSYCFQKWMYFLFVSHLFISVKNISMEIPNYSGTCLKAFTSIEAPANIVSNVLLDITKRKEYDISVEECQELEKIGPHIDVVRVLYVKLFPGFKKR
jgi:hypothetical protein